MSSASTGVSDLSSFLDGLHDEGTLSSSGAFTIDAGRGQEVLGLYLLRDSRQWVLKLVQWAVALGAANIELSLEPNRAKLRHDGGELDVNVRPTLLSSAGDSEVDWARRELMIALQVVAQLHPHAISIVQAYDDEARMERFEVRSGALEAVQSSRLSQWPWPDRLEQTVFTVDLSAPLSPEDIGWMRDEVGRRTTFCPANVTMKGSLFGRDNPDVGRGLTVAQLGPGWSPWSLGLHASAGKTFEEESGRTLESGFFPASCVSRLNPTVVNTPRVPGGTLANKKLPQSAVHFVHLGVLLEPYPWQEAARRNGQAWMCDNPGFNRYSFARSTRGLALDATGESLVLDRNAAVVLKQLIHARRQLQKVLQRVDPALQLTL